MDPDESPTTAPSPRALVRPLEPRWQDVLDDVLARSGVSTRDVARLGPAVEELSRAYNAGMAQGKRTRLPLDARIAFSFARDVPKGAGAARELVASGALTMPEGRPLRVLDLGAGLGAMTWGLARALAAGGATGRIESLLVDEDEEVLARAEDIARSARSASEQLSLQGMEVAIATRLASVATIGARRGPSIAPADVVLLGQVLSELDPPGASPDADAGARAERHAALVRTILDTLVTKDGSLVIVEPALRDRTRHLHAVRDRVLEGGRLDGGATVTVFAPCLHAGRCPALLQETDWCHEDLAVDLPPWLVPLARAAGLRWQGLTFSYLVLRKDGRSLATGRDVADGDASGSRDRGRFRFRVISSPIVTKGKTELFVCAEDGNRSKIRRLDRDRGKESGASFDDLRRGDIVTLATPGAVAPLPDATQPAVVDERGRVQPVVHVTIDGARLRH